MGSPSKVSKLSVHDILALAPNASVPIECLVAMRANFPATWDVENVCSPYARLYFILKGHGEIRLKDFVMPIEPGHVVYVPRDCLSHYRAFEEIELFWTHFSYQDRDGRYRLTENVEQWCYAPKDLAYTQRSFETLTESYAHDEFLSLAALQLLISPFIVSEASTHECQLSLRLNIVVEFMHSNDHRHVSLDELAQIAKLHPSYLVSTFRKIYGTPPGSYHLQWRLNKVKRLLRDSAHTLDAIAETTGFCDAFHLSKIFKKHVGISPRSFRSFQLNSAEVAIPSMLIGKPEHFSPLPK